MACSLINSIVEAHEFFWLTAVRSLTLFDFLLLHPSLNKENTRISDASSALYVCLHASSLVSVGKDLQLQELVFPKGLSCLPAYPQ